MKAGLCTLKPLHFTTLELVVGKRGKRGKWEITASSISVSPPSCSCSQLFSWIINNYYQMIKLQIFVNFIIINTIILIFSTLFVFLEKTTVTELIDSGLDSSQEAFSVRDVHCVTILQCPPCPVICKGFNLKAFQFSSKKSPLRRRNDHFQMKSGSEIAVGGCTFFSEHLVFNRNLSKYSIKVTCGWKLWSSIVRYWLGRVAASLAMVR